MLRFIARVLGYWLVAAALVAAIVDGAKSIAASALVLTPVAETWSVAAAYLGFESGAGAATSAPWPLDLLLAWLLAAPTVAVLAAGGVALLVAGARRRRPSIGRELAT